MGANTQNPDIQAYIIAFNPDRISSDFGYSILVLFFDFMGFDYESFRLIISAFGIILIHQTVKKFLKNQSPFYLLYFIYPFLIDIVQVRNFLVMSLLIYSTPYLLTGKNKDYFKFIFSILIASTIQLTAIVYLPIIFVAKAKKNILFKCILIFNIIVLIIISANKNLLGLLAGSAVLMLGEYDNRIGQYGFIQTNYGFLLLWFFQIANFVLVAWAKNIYCNNIIFKDKGLKTKEKTYFSNKDEDIKAKYMLLIYWINIYAFLFLPFYVFQITFSRFIRNLIPLNLIAFLIIEQMQNKNYNKYLFRLIYLSYHLFILWADLNWLYPNININDFFEYNWLIGN